MGVLDPELHAAGLQCELRLWRAAHEGEPAPRGEVSTPGELAELRAALGAQHPDALRIEAPGAPDAVRRTRAALIARRPLLDAVLEGGGARARIALLEPLDGDAWGLRDLRSVERVRDTDRDRAALLLHLARASGLRCGSVEVRHPDPGYVRRGALDPSRLLRREDLTSDAEFLAGDAGAELERMRAVVAGAEPGIEPSPHCFRPSRCPHRERCTAQRPDAWVGFVPRLRPQLWHQLCERGIERMDAIPDELRTGAEARNARDAARSGRCHVAPALRAELARARAPVAFLDFEAVSPAVPLFDDTRPFEALPVQWSLHRRGPGVGLSHADYLHEGDGDPRPAFADALIDGLGTGDGSIVVYSSFEDGVLERLARRLPDRAPALHAIRARLLDLLGLLRAHVYDPAFRGVFTLKRVATVIAPDAPGWDDLEIRDGAAAARAWLELLRGETPPAGVGALRAALAAYCARDTLNPAAVWRALEAG